MILIEELRAAYKGKVFAFVPLANTAFRSKPPFMLCVAVLGERGYSPLPHFFDSYDAADDRAETLNKELGYSMETSMAIVADTMQRSQRAKDEVNGMVTVKFEQVEISFLIEAIRKADLGSVHADEDRLVEKLEEAMDEMEPADVKFR